MPISSGLCGVLALRPRRPVRVNESPNKALIEDLLEESARS